MSDATKTPDETSKPDAAKAGKSAKASAGDAAGKAKARPAQAVPLPASWEDAAIDAAFDDLLDSKTRDLVALAAEIEEAEKDAAQADRSDVAARPAEKDVTDATAHGDRDEAMRALYALDEDDPLDQLLTSQVLPEAPRGDRPTDAVICRQSQLTVDQEDARSKLLALGGAADSAMLRYDGPFSHLQRLCLLSLDGDERLARRAAAADVVRPLPDLAPLALRFSESHGPAVTERLGLELAGLIDQRAMNCGDSTLHRLGTGILLVCLAWPIIRLEPAGVAVDRAGEPPRGAGAESGSRLSDAALRPMVKRADLPVGQPLSHDLLQAVLARRDGLAPLPFGERAVSISDLVLRIAAALRGQSSGGTRALDAWAKIERVHLGLGLLLSGASPDWQSLERPLPALAHDVASRTLNHTLHEVHDLYHRKLEEVQRKRANQMKACKADADDLDVRLKATREALETLGLDETGKPLVADGQDAGFDGAPHEVIVCPVIANITNSKVKDAVLGHEHMLGKPVALAPTLDLQRRRATLIAEFPYAAGVIDFVLGDLVNRATVTIRPLLLTGTPGSGKTHFARRFAELFDLHLWSVDCGGADGAVFAGTDRRWHSAEPSHPFLAMSRGRMANPLVLLDELEKAPTRQDYGRMCDSLLPFLEPGSNRSVQDKCLQVAIDASHINYIATANRLDPLPWQLRDRFRVIAFPEPTAAHLEALIPPLIAELARVRSLDPRFIAPPDPEEQSFIAQRWRGGSVRRLARLIEAIVNARERAMPRH